MAKTSAKTSKTSGTPAWTSTKAWRTKMEVGENGEGGLCGWLHGKRPNFVVTSNLPLIFTKLSLWTAELQKCHYWTSNVGSFTQLMWN